MTTKQTDLATINREYSPAMRAYLRALVDLSPNANGDVDTDQQEIRRLIDLGKQVASNLNAGLIKLGNVAVYAHEEMFCKEGYGWVVANVGEMMEAIGIINGLLEQTIVEGKWTTQTYAFNKAPFVSLLSQLPYSNFSPSKSINVAAARNIIDWHSWSEGAQERSLMELSESILSAIQSGELSNQDVLMVNLLLAECAALIVECGQAKIASEMALEESEAA